jgi:hypothetical protein
MPFGPKHLKPIACDLSELKPIPNCDGYFINESGEVFCVRKMSTYFDSDGYERVTLRKNGRRFHRGIHALLAAVFLPPAKPGQNEVRHLDGKSSNRSIDNLAWGTRAENAADLARHGTVKGERNSRAILTAEAIVEIRSTKKSYGYVRRLAEKFGVSRGAVKAVLAGRNWSHV